jgi:hypothetical protein
MIPNFVSDHDAGGLLGEMLNIATGSYATTFTPEGKEAGVWEGKPALFDFRLNRTAAFVFTPEGVFDGFWVQTPEELAPVGIAERGGGRVSLEANAK